MRDLHGTTTPKQPAIWGVRTNRAARPCLPGTYRGRVRQLPRNTRGLKLVDPEANPAPSSDVCVRQLPRNTRGLKPAGPGSALYMPRTSGQTIASEYKRIETGPSSVKIKAHVVSSQTIASEYKRIETQPGSDQTPRQHFKVRQLPRNTRGLKLYVSACRIVDVDGFKSDNCLGIQEDAAPASGSCPGAGVFYVGPVDGPVNSPPAPSIRACAAECGPPISPRRPA